MTTLAGAISIVSLVSAPYPLDMLIQQSPRLSPTRFQSLVIPHLSMQVNGKVNTLKGCVRNSVKDLIVSTFVTQEEKLTTSQFTLQGSRPKSTKSTA